MIIYLNDRKNNLIFKHNHNKCLLMTIIIIKFNIKKINIKLKEYCILLNFLIYYIDY